MPKIHRTPPPSPASEAPLDGKTAAAAAVACPQQQGAFGLESTLTTSPHYCSGSAPDLTAVDVDQEYAKFVNDRSNKRKRFSEVDELKTSIDSLNKLLSSNMLQQELKFKKLMATVKEIRDQNESIRQSVDYLSKEYSELKGKFTIMENEKKEQLLYIKTLEDRIEGMEKYHRSSSIEIRNIPLKTGESKRDLSETIIKMSERLNVPIQKNEIKDVFRTKSKSENKPIVVELTTILKREDFLDSVKKYKRERNGILDTSSLGISGPPVKIFISEALTAKNKRIFTLARDFAKTNSYKYCWTSHGTVYLRQGDGQPAIRIASFEDLDRLKSKI